MEFDQAVKMVFLDLLIKHRNHARDRNEADRVRVYNMLDDLEWAYPQLKEKENGET